MPMYTTNSPAILRPEDVGDLIVRPVIAASVALSTTTVARTTSRDYRIPVVAEDPTAQWVAEGAEITPDDMVLA